MRWNLDELSDLSPDLEWLLLSGQASRAVLAEALAEEFYPSIFNLALIFLGEEKAARAVALQTFQIALANIDRYRPSFGVKAWLYRQVVKPCLRTGGKTWRLQRLRKIAIYFNPISEGENLSHGLPDDPLFEAIHALPVKLRMAVLLRYLAGLEVQEIAWILRQAEGQVRASLDTAWQKLQAGLRPVEEENLADSSELIFSRWLSARCPTRPITQLERKHLLASLAGRENRQRRLASLGNLLWIGLAVLSAVGLSQGNRLESPAPEVTPILSNPPAPTSTPDYSVSYFAQPGETLLSISAKTGISLQELTRINPFTPDEVFNRVRQVRLPEPPVSRAPTPIPPLRDLPDPLTIHSQPDRIKQRLSTSRSTWHTLWVDSQFIDYGPPGYVGTPRTYRSQVWISLPDESIQLVGPIGGKPVYRFLIQGKYVYFFTPERNASWYSETPELLVSWSALYSLIFPDRAQWLHEPGELQVTGEEETVGRRAIVADWRNPSGQRLYRIWIDAQTGIILHQQEFGGQDGQVLIADNTITAITYNADFPPELFDPRQSRLEYVQDYMGLPQTGQESPSTVAASQGRQPLKRLPVPVGLDPARSLLTFQYPENPASRESAPMVDLFAGRVYLGRFPFVDPWNMLCDRSPDGRRIAFTLKPGWQQARRPHTAGLEWLDLAELKIHSLPGPMEVINFAFAPDSQRLAVFSYPAGSTPGLDLVDTSSGEITRLLELEQAESLAWSSDGKQLALVGKRPGESQLEAMIIQASSGAVFYSIPVDLQVYQQVLAQPGQDPEWPTRDWPGHAWQIRFPVRMGELETCSAPPQ